MDIIHENPFRVLGLFANSTERELQKQVAKIKRFLDVGKAVHFQTDYPFLTCLDRSMEKIAQATAHIEQSHKKLYYALFWFVTETPFDEIAQNKLSENEIDSAIEIWRTRLKSEVTETNFSSYLNLSTLLIALSFDKGRINKQMLAEGLNLKGRLLQSNSLSKLTTLLHIKSDYVDSDRLMAEFVDETLSWLTPLIDNPHGIKKFELEGLFSTFPSELRKKIVDRQTEEPIREIKSRIERCEEKRNENPLEADNFGKDLYYSTKGWLSSLSRVIDSDDLKYQLLVNSLAAEILQCSVSYFNSQSEDENYDAHDEALAVLNLAEKLNPTGQTQNRVQDNRRKLEELMQSREEEREKKELLSAIEPNIDSLADKVKAFQNKQASITTAAEFIKESQQELNSIIAEIGEDNDLCIMFSDAVVNNALNMLIDVVNGVQKNAKLYGLDRMLKIITNARNLTRQLSNMSCSPEVKSRVRKNLNTINSMVESLESIKSNNSGGCYIATMAYGSYDHPQVMALRRYRDKVLKASLPGRIFIKVYYAVSPFLVSLLAGHQTINAAIRVVLDKLIKVIEK